MNEYFTNNGVFSSLSMILTLSKHLLNQTANATKHINDMYMSYGWGSNGENVTSERKKT